MAIPEAELTSMASIGAQRTSKETYATIKLALDDVEAGYHSMNYEIFLQGSYGNDTNIFRESDVDVVIRLDSIFTYDLVSLPQSQQEAFKARHPPAAYNHINFRSDVLAALKVISLYTSFFTNKINDLQPPFLRPRQQGDERRIGWFDTKYPLFA